MNMKMPGLRMLEGTMTAIEGAYLITQGQKMNVQVLVVRNLREEGNLMEIRIRDSVIHNFEKALSRLRRIAEAEMVDIPSSDEEEAQS